jgi:hypothetical protein
LRQPSALTAVGLVAAGVEVFDPCDRDGCDLNQFGAQPARIGLCEGFGDLSAGTSCHPAPPRVCFSGGLARRLGFGGGLLQFGAASVVGTVLLSLGFELLRRKVVIRSGYERSCDRSLGLLW